MKRPQKETWVVTIDQAQISADMVVEAAAAQASLAEKLAQFRGLDEPFPAAVVPMDTNRWIETGGDPNPSPTP